MKTRRTVILALGAVATAGAVATLFVMGAIGQGGPEAPLPPEKQAIIDLEKARQATAEKGPHAPKHPEDTGVKSCPVDFSAFKSWIKDMKGDDALLLTVPPFRGTRLINSAQVIGTGGVPHLIFAGSFYNDSQQGIVIVWERDRDPCASAAGVAPRPKLQLYKTASQEGALTIAQVDGDSVVLATAAGRTIRFNYVTGVSEPTDAMVLSAPGPAAAPASTGGSTSSLLSVASVAIDTDTSNTPPNTATSLGTLQVCNTLGTGGTLAIDVVAAGIPPASGGTGGIIGLQFNLLYDSSKVTIAASDPRMLLAATSGSSVSSAGDAAPDSDGNLLVEAFDTSQSTPESGDGVLARITLQGVAAGISSLTLTDVQIVDAANNLYAIGSVEGAQVVVDASCP